VVLDLTFALRTRRHTEANVKSTTLAATVQRDYRLFFRKAE
jgi:hypothetical protein